MWPFTRQKAATANPATQVAGWRRILEPFAGAWQTGTTLDVADVSGYPTLYACLDRISSDIGKLPWYVKQRGSDGIGRIVPCKQLERPNSFQTPSQFRQAWVLALLQQGNAVVLRSPELIVLDWDHVTPLVSEAGEVFYRISTASRSVMPAEFNGRTVTVPASAVMHDRRACLFNQLVGVSPLTAAFLPAAKNYFALTNAKNRFAKGDNMGGVLTVPASIDEASAAKLREEWATTTAQNIRVVGADATFTRFDSKSTDSQLVEQLQLSDKQICAPFHVPPFIVGAEALPSGQRPDQYMDVYLRLALQHLIDGIETHLTAGLALPAGQYVEIDTAELLRMAPTELGAFHTGLVKGGVETRNEARRALGLPPVDGGDVITVQVQDVPLGGQAHGAA